MELTDLNQTEQKLLLALYSHEMDSACEVMPAGDLLSLLAIEPIDLNLSFR
jgi:hypothetical protein